MLKHSPKEVAQWMLDEFNKRGELFQLDAVSGIQIRFGQNFIYTNQNGNEAIDTKVLSEFKKLTGDGVVWERGERYWRRRENCDEPGRQQG